MTAIEFETSLRAFVQELVGDGVTIRRNTLLFENGIIDSMRVVDLIAFVESRLSVRIPDEKITLEHFRSIEAIRRSFCR
ncbi:MAG TPA: acyl carrier protein [Thermoanaerobaculia bacterium]